MSPGRLNALTDGVVAIVLTIMVLELKFPAEPTVGAVLAVLPLLAAYLLAFVNVAIYWNNHHHMMQSTHKVTGAVLWANHALLFWLTLFPLMIRWIDEAGITSLPVASFGIVLLSIPRCAHRASRRPPTVGEMTLARWWLVPVGNHSRPRKSSNPAPHQ